MEDRLPRRLAAILYADVAGYSRLTGQDEDATHRVLSEYLDLITDMIVSQQGLVMHYAGDAVLARFDAVVDALSAATRIQETLRIRNQSLPESSRIQFRIGVNLGDVIEDRDDIYGDGVNVAARLESLAEPGGVCISGAVYDAIGSQLPLAYEFLGEQRVKNIDRPVRTFKIEVDQAASDHRVQAIRRRPGWPVVAGLAALAAVATTVFLVVNRPSTQERGTPGATPTESPEPSSSAGIVAEVSSSPSIAVLPFNNLSENPEQEYFSDGLSEDLITDLSRISGLRVIARHSSFAYKGQGGDIQKIGRELGARYVLGGSVRRSGEWLRINAQLIDAGDGTHLWAERYDRKLTDVFELQDEVTQTIVSALAVNLTSEEERFLDRVRTANPDAYDALLRGLEPLHRFTRDDSALAREYFAQAIALDPDYARAHANLALTHAQDVTFGWTDDPHESIRLSVESAQRAKALDDTITQTHFTLSATYLARRMHAEAEKSIRRAIELDPNYADGYGQLANILSYAGRQIDALPAIRRAKRLNPRYPFVYLWIEGHIYFLMGRSDDAILTFREVLDRNPAFETARLALIATYGEIEMEDEANWEVDELLTLRPGYSLTTARQESLYKRPEDLERVVKGLRRAGIPE